MSGLSGKILTCATRGAQKPLSPSEIFPPELNRSSPEKGFPYPSDSVSPILSTSMELSKPLSERLTLIYALGAFPRRMCP